MLSYATPDQLAEWLDGTLPDAATRFLRSATVIVAKAANLNPYGPEPTGDAAQALQDATCAQVASWITLGIDPAALGLDTAPVKKSSILGGDVERDTSGQTQSLQEAAECICAEAAAILEQTGLLWQAVPLIADWNPLPDYGLSIPRHVDLEFALETDWPFI